MFDEKSKISTINIAKIVKQILFWYFLFISVIVLPPWIFKILYFFIFYSIITLFYIFILSNSLIITFCWAAHHTHTCRMKKWTIPRLVFHAWVSDMGKKKHRPILLIFHGYYKLKYQTEDQLTCRIFGIDYFEGTAIWSNNSRAIDTIFPHCNPIRKHFVVQKRV